MGRYGRGGEGLGTSGGMVGVGRSGYKWKGMVGVGCSISGVKERESHSEPLSWKGEQWQSDWYHSSESS